MPIWVHGKKEEEEADEHSPDLSPGAQKMGYPSRPIHIQMVTAVERGLKAFGEGNKWDCLSLLLAMFGVLNFTLQCIEFSPYA